jgi:hypothetical protein
MIALFLIMIIVGAFLLVVGIATMAGAYDGVEAFMGFIGLVLGFGLFIGGLSGGAADASRYNEETVRLCDKKDGVVSQDGHCFVDNKPVEFTPGVWER